MIIVCLFSLLYKDKLENISDKNIKPQIWLVKLTFVFSTLALALLHCGFLCKYQELLFWPGHGRAITRASARPSCSGRRLRGEPGGGGAAGQRGRLAGTGWSWAASGSLVAAGSEGSEGWRGTGGAEPGRPGGSGRAAPPASRRKLNIRDYHASTSASPAVGD